MKLTDIDRHALGLIRKCGFVTFDFKEGPCLETNEQISTYRLKRLEALGLIKPSDDAMFGAAAQTWRPVTPDA